MADIITKAVGDKEWLINLNLLTQLNAWKFDLPFISQFVSVRKQNKQNLINLLMKTPKNKEILSGFVEQFMAGKEDIMIDVMAKRIGFAKRQIMYLFYILLRYLRIKENPKS